MPVVLIVLAVFFALNMGGANFAAAFAAPYGGKIIGRKKAALLFTLFVTLGSVTLGENVSLTLKQAIVPADLVVSRAVTTIFIAAGLSMYISNLMKIPQSTSLVTVAAITGVGVYYGQLNVGTLLYLLPFWLLLPIVSYFLTLSISGAIYPPRKGNFWVYERFINHQDKLKVLVIAMSCYNSFAVGTNNVANVAGPLIGAWEGFTLLHLLLVFAVIYGAGAFVFIEPIKTAGNKIVPLGLLTASIISMVSGTLMLFASALGIPQSFVMLKMGAIFAVSSLKDGQSYTFQKPVTQRTLYSWAINPIITFLTSWGLSFALNGTR